MSENPVKSNTANSVSENGNSEPELSSGEKSDTGEPPNRRLSAETLFAFALPEAVRKKAESDLIEQVKNKKSSKEEKAEVKQADVQSSPASGSQMPWKVVPIILGLVGLFFAYQGGALDSMKKSLESASQSSGSPAPLGVNSNLQIAESGNVARKAPPMEPNSDNGMQEAVDTSKVKASEPSNIEISTKSDSLAKELSKPVEIDSSKPASLSDAQLAKAIEQENEEAALVSLIQEVAARAGSAELLEAVVSKAEHPSYLVRVGVFRGIVSSNGNFESIQGSIDLALLAGLDDKDEIVRGFAAKAIGKRGSKSMLTKLRGKLDTEESDIVTRIIKASIKKLDS